MNINRTEEDIDTEGKPSIIATVLGYLCLPLTLFSCYELDQGEEAVLLSYGAYWKTQKEPGCHWANCIGREIKKISKKHQTLEVPVNKILDLHGNPVTVSGIVTYYVKNSKKATLDVEDYHQFILSQATASMKRVVSQYPYESNEGDSLKLESAVIGTELVNDLQQKVQVAGIKVVSFQFNEMSYAPEIAQVMLRKQQATAILNARKTIVDGAVNLVHSATQQLQEKNVSLTENDKSKLITNLMTVMCADNNVQPTLNLS